MLNLPALLWNILCLVLCRRLNQSSNPWYMIFKGPSSFNIQWSYVKLKNTVVPSDAHKNMDICQRYVSERSQKQKNKWYHILKFKSRPTQSIVLQLWITIISGDEGVLNGKNNKETMSMGARNILYVDLSGDRMYVCICKNSQNICALQGIWILYCIFSKILIKQWCSVVLKC